MKVQRVLPSSNNSESEVKRERAQKLNYAKIEELVQRNVNKLQNRTFLQYTKDLVKTYVRSPMANQDTIREISRFLCRNSMLYQKLLMYYATTPLFYYNIVQDNDFSKAISKSKSIKGYETVLKEFNRFNIKKEMYTALFMALRDGIYVAFEYNSDSGKRFFMPLDCKYCRVFGKNEDGEWVVYFNASFFDSGDNKIFVEGSDGSGSGAWDDVFAQGYIDYKNNGKDFMWFRLPPERTFCLLIGSEDELTFPLPFFLPLFISLLDLLDLEQIIQSKTELENYKLIVSKIPLLSGSDDVDDFAISNDLAEYFNLMLENSVPDLVGAVYSPMDIDVVTFDKSNKTSDTDELSKSIQNLFNNAGASQLVVAGGASSSVTALKHALQNDMATTWVWVNRIESWLNYYIKKNISEGYELSIHRCAWYNHDEYIANLKDAFSFGGSAMDYFTALGDTPYTVYQKLRFESAIGIKDLLVPPQTSYTQSGKSEGGRPTKDADDLSEEGAKNRNKSNA